MDSYLELNENKERVVPEPLFWLADRNLDVELLLSRAFFMS